LKVVKCDGIYFDFGTSRMCSNPLHGCGWKDNSGQLNSTYNIRGTRELAKRMYVLINKYCNDAIIVHHMSGEVDMGTNSFCDIMLDGENLTGAMMTDESYFNSLPLDKFRAEFMGQPWGTATLFLPQFVRALSVVAPQRVDYLYTPEAKKLMNHVLGLTLVHDGAIWCQGTEKPDKMWAVENEFGWDEKTQCLPYWDNAEYITVESPISKNVVVTMFRHGDKLMVVPFNNTDEKVMLKIKLNLDKLGINETSAKKLTDKFGSGTFEVKNGAAEIPMESRAFRMLVLEQ